MTDLSYRQVTCKRDVRGAAFSAGIQDYDFSIGGNVGFLPSKSYFRIGLRITNATNAQPTHEDLLAPSDDVAACLFDNAYFKIGGQDVSSIVNYLPQASVLKNRIEKTGAWLNTVGKSSRYLDADFQSRSDKISTFSGSGLTVGSCELFHDTGKIISDKTPFTTVVVGDVLILGYSTLSRYSTTLKCKVIAKTDATEVTIRLLDGFQMPYKMSSIGMGDQTSITSINVVTHKEPSDGHNIFYVIYQPPLSIFDHDGVLGSGSYRIQLNPNSYYQSSAVEKMLNTSAGGILEVQNIEFYCATIRTNIPSTGIEKLYLNEMSLQSKKITSGDQTLDFTVPSSTKSLIIFLQSTSAGSNQRFPPTKFSVEDNSERHVRSIQVSYANQVQPSTRWTSEYTNTTQYLTQRYNDSITANGLIFSSGGAESLQDYLKRGPYYMYSFDKSSDDRSSHVQVSLDLGFSPVECNLFLASCYSKVVEVSVNNGYVDQVNSLVV